MPDPPPPPGLKKARAPGQEAGEDTRAAPAPAELSEEEGVTRRRTEL